MRNNNLLTNIELHFSYVDEYNTRYHIEDR